MNGNSSIYKSLANTTFFGSARIGEIIHSVSGLRGFDPSLKCIISPILTRSEKVVFARLLYILLRSKQSKNSIRKICGFKNERTQRIQHLSMVENREE